MKQTKNIIGIVIAIILIAINGGVIYSVLFMQQYTDRKSVV